MRAGRGQPMAGAVRHGPSGGARGCAARRQTEDLRRGRRSAHSGAARPAAAHGTGFARWTAPLHPKELGDISDQHILRFLRSPRIDLAGRKSWCVSTDPEFAAKAADIVGLYLDPPDHAIVLAVDEKPAIQALERAQGYLKLPNGRSLHGQAHEYKRRGTTTLFAALEIATGAI